jgi:FlaA1/EpsC-like NDP-sugar epimerase
MATAFLFSREGLPAVIKSDYPEMLYCVFPIVVLLHIGGIYRRCWVRACGREYIYLTEIMLVGNVIAAIIRYNVQAPAGIKIFLAFHGFFFLSASAFILSERVGLRVLRNSVIKKNLYLRRFGLKNLPKVLIYGGGQCCYFYLYNHHRNIESKPLYVIGIMDDHPVLQGQYVHGYQVFGGAQMLSKIHAEHRFDRLVITCEIDDPQKKKEILDFCRNHGVVVSEFLFHEADVAVE